MRPAPLQAHSRRVAALALEIASRLRLKPRETDILVQAASLHHYPDVVLDPLALERLLKDLKLQMRPAPGAPFPPAEVREVLTRFRLRHGSDTPGLLAQIIDVANLFDERLEFHAFEPMKFEQIIDELDWIARDGFFEPAIVAALAALPQVHIEELLDQIQRLPVFPGILLKALELTADEDSSFSQIERIIRNDQVLAGNVLQAANSSLYSPVRRISSIPQAISYIGLDACRKVLMAGVFQPLFYSAPLRELWRHSLAMAQVTERVALLTGKIDPQAAFLAGLVHDVGRLAIQKARREHVAAYQRVIDAGAEPVFSEILITGTDHGAIGASILRQWIFPEDLVEAVQYHHRPEATESLLASVLYLAEICSGSNEDIESAARLEFVEDRLGFDLELPKGQIPPGLGWLDFLAA